MPSPPNPFDPDRFKRAQDSDDAGFETAMLELRSGRKDSHWIWYVFPQVAGLGRSSMAALFALAGIDEAMDYLRDPVLRKRLLAAAAAVAEQLERSPMPALDDLMGSRTDALKLISSLTLFREAASRLNVAEPSPAYAALAGMADIILEVAARQGFEPCQFTLRLISRS